MSLATWDTITGALGSTTTAFGGDWGNLVSDFLNGVNVGLADPSKLPRINTLTRFKFEKLGLFDTDESHEVEFSVDDIDTGPTRKVKIRRMNNPFETDYMVLEGLPQTLLNKTINADSNTITNIENADIKAAAGIVYSKLALSSSILNSDVNASAAIAYSKLALTGSILNADVNASAGIVTTKLADSTNFVLTNRTNTFGAFAQTVPYDMLRIMNSGGTFYSQLRSAATANRTPSFPDDSGTLATNSSTTSWTNKTMDADGTGNSITNIENADIKAAAGIVYSKLTLTGGILNADINASAAIAKTKLASLDVVNADVNASAAIATTKLADSSNFILKTLDNAFGAHFQDFTKMTAPASPGANDIRLYVDTADTHLKVKNNAGTVVDLSAGGGGGGVTASSTDTFTNKTIDALTNTIKNVGPATYEIWIESGPVYKARRISTGVVTSNSNAKTLFQAVLDDMSKVATNANARGGKLFVRSGEYQFDGVVQVSNSINQAFWVVIEGEGHTNTVFKSITNATHLFDPYCNTVFKGIHFDGNAIGTQLIGCGEPVYVHIFECRFSRAMDITVWFGGLTANSGGVKGFIVNRCIFDDPRSINDEFAFTCSEYGIISNNRFDRSTLTGGSTFLHGSAITSGGGNNIVVNGNTIYRTPTSENNGNGLSFEPFDANDYNNVTVTGNIFYKGPVLIGDSAYENDEKYRNFTVTGNTLYGNKIHVLGRTVALGGAANSIKNITITGNTIVDAFDAAIKCERVIGPITITSNTIVESNRGGNANTNNDNGLIWLKDSGMVNCQNNNLLMSDATSLHSPYGIRVDTVTYSSVKNNNIKVTNSNPAIVQTGVNTGTTVKENIGYNETFTYIKDNLGSDMPFINTGAQSAPDLHIHMFPDYIKQGAATEVDFYYGFNSQFRKYMYYSKWSGTNTLYFEINPGGNYVASWTNLYVGQFARIYLDETGLTAQRTYTFPDATAKLVGDTSAQTITNKTIQASSNTLSGVAQNPLNKRWGTVQAGYGTAVGTVGVFDGLCQQFTANGGGSNTTSFDTTEGKIINYQTANSSGVIAGLSSNAAGGGIGRRLFGGRMICRVKLDSTTSARFYFGLTSATALPISETVLANTDSGIIVGFNAGDTNYQIRTNDGATSVTTTQMTGPVAKTSSTSFHTIEISWTAAGNYTVTFDGTAQTISTDLPATTTDLYPNLMVQTSAAVQRTLTVRAAYIEADQ